MRMKKTAVYSEKKEKHKKERKKKKPERDTITKEMAIYPEKKKMK